MPLSQSRMIHWRAPVLMLSSLLTGAVLILGHHLFYASLSGRNVSDTRYDQQWNIRIGTAFSYLVRCALVIAVGVCYWQCFWAVVSRKRLSVAKIDILTGILNDLTDMLNPMGLRTSPLLFLLGIVSWLVPLATVVPPATLTVLSTDFRRSDMALLSTVSWTSNALIQAPAYRESDSVPYNGPARELSRLVASIATQGQLPSIPALRSNISYEVSLPGPALHCIQVQPNVILDAFDTVIGDSISCPYANASCYAHYGYLSWVPNKLYNSPSDVPFPADSMNISGAGTLPVEPPKYTLEKSSYLGSLMPNSDGAPITLFVASRLLDENWSLLNCSLWNATYTIEMNFTENLQSVFVRRRDLDQSISLWFAPEPEKARRDFGYYAMMESLGKQLVGSVHWTIMDETSFITTTNALDTELAFTHELFPIYNGSLVHREVQVPRGDGNGTFPRTVSLFDPNSTDPNAYRDRRLGPAIEELFTNMTLSLFARPEFLQPAPSPTNVTTHLWHNVYAYSASQLWISYGLALAASSIAVAVGLGTNWLNQASYSNRFSTFLRATCEDEVRSRIRPQDRSGVDPLPAYIKNQEILLCHGEEDGLSKTQRF